MMTCTKCAAGVALLAPQRNTAYDIQCPSSGQSYFKHQRSDYILCLATSGTKVPGSWGHGWERSGAQFSWKENRNRNDALPGRSKGAVGGNRCLALFPRGAAKAASLPAAYDKVKGKAQDASQAAQGRASLFFCSLLGRGKSPTNAKIHQATACHEGTNVSPTENQVITHARCKRHAFPPAHPHPG